MKTVRFKSLKIRNFKGTESLDVNFDQTNDVKGRNRSGKTTLFDAMVWCLFGKNSADKKEFGIKNKVNTELNRADHLVELVMEVNGQENTLRRVYKEKWTKKRGEESATYDSNETEYFWNSVPCTMKEFDIRINEIIAERMFKILTIPLFFNEKMTDAERRETIVAMAGELPDEKVINGTPAYQELFARLKGQKSLEDYRKEISYEKSALRKSLESIPHRIDEVLKSNPQSQDWAGIQKEIDQKLEAIKNLESEIEGVVSYASKANETVNAHHDKRREAKVKMVEIANGIKDKDWQDVLKANQDIDKADYELVNIDFEIKTLTDRIATWEANIKAIEEDLEALRSQWREENAKAFTFDREGCKCDKCGTPFKSADIEALEQEHLINFNQGKNSNLALIKSRGDSMGASKSVQIEHIKTTAERLASLRARREEILPIATKARVEPMKDIDALIEKNAEYIRLKAIAEAPVPEYIKADVSELKEMKDSLTEGIDELKKLLLGKDQLERNSKRVEELKAEEKKLAKELADLEKTEFTIESFMKKRMDMIEKSVNDKFSFVSFQLFESQVNGGERQVFKTMVGGVPYADVNRADQINAGLDIINALSAHYGITAPIIIDNAEAVNEFIPTNSQTIRLYVTNDPVLTVN